MMIEYYENENLIVRDKVSNLSNITLQVDHPVWITKIILEKTFNRFTIRQLVGSNYPLILTLGTTLHLKITGDLFKNLNTIKLK